MSRSNFILPPAVQSSFQAGWKSSQHTTGKGVHWPDNHAQDSSWPGFPLQVNSQGHLFRTKHRAGPGWRQKLQASCSSRALRVERHSKLQSSVGLQELSWAPGAQEITYSTASSPGGVSPTAPPPQLPAVVLPTAPEERQTTRLSTYILYTKSDLLRSLKLLVGPSLGGHAPPEAFSYGRCQLHLQ